MVLAFSFSLSCPPQPFFISCWVYGEDSVFSPGKECSVVLSIAGHPLSQKTDAYAFQCLGKDIVGSSTYLRPHWAVCQLEACSVSRLWPLRGHTNSAPNRQGMTLPSVYFVNKEKMGMISCCFLFQILCLLLLAFVLVKLGISLAHTFPPLRIVDWKCLIKMKSHALCF